MWLINLKKNLFALKETPLLALAQTLSTNPLTAKTSCLFNTPDLFISIFRQVLLVIFSVCLSSNEHNTYQRLAEVKYLIFTDCLSSILGTSNNTENSTPSLDPQPVITF